jgi:hypothetical protein
MYHRVSTSVFLLGLSVLFVLALSACGGGGGGGGGGADDGAAAPETETEATTMEATTMETTAAEAPGTLPFQGTLPAGEYDTEDFEPAFSFRVGEGWEVYFSDLQDVVYIVLQGTGGARPSASAPPRRSSTRASCPRRLRFPRPRPPMGGSPGSESTPASTRESRPRPASGASRGPNWT